MEEEWFCCVKMHNNKNNIISRVFPIYRINKQRKVFRQTVLGLNQRPGVQLW